MRAGICGLWLAGVLCAPIATASEPPVERIRWISPWTVGTVLVYDTEEFEDEQRDDAPRETTRITSKEAIRISEATADGGFVQEWTWSDTDYQLIAGDEAAFAFMRSVAESIGELPLVVELDAESSFRGLRNLGQISTAMQEKLTPALRRVAREEAGKAAPKTLSKAQRGKMLADADARVDAMMAKMLSPAVLQAMLASDVQIYNDFVGVELEHDARYEIETELDNPLGERRFPATLEFGLYVSEDDADDVFLEWTSTIDPDEGFDILLDAASTLFGEAVPDADRATLARGMSLVDTGFILFRRSTGVVEMLQSQRNLDFGPMRKLERRRMRLIDTDHDHVWVEADAEDSSS